MNAAVILQRVRTAVHVQHTDIHMALIHAYTHMHMACVHDYDVQFIAYDEWSITVCLMCSVWRMHGIPAYSIQHTSLRSISYMCSYMRTECDGYVSDPVEWEEYPYHFIADRNQ
jgi:hypothetical protein